ncbi:unnamed protein product [Adineta ricciae]|uniref:BZIP domain-containing protein n=1 Tax=Adineta ricciae TaxID=249248 RepID=A0A814Y7E9_ADIRI|nr:unnamed protein product [Adineta ricciae]
MGSVEKDISHDHIYLSNISVEKDCHQARNSSDTRRRVIRKKCDIQTEEDRQMYFRRRTLNNASCRISRIHRRTKLDLIHKKCAEYEDLNTKLIRQEGILFEVINQLKEHLRSLVSNDIPTNE